MDLFSKDDSYKEYEQFKKAREDFKDANTEMRDTIDLKTWDNKNVNYAFLKNHELTRNKN